MRLRSLFAATTALTLGVPAFAQPATPAPEAAPQDSPATTTADAAANANDAGEVVVTARKREETLLNVPVAATALTGAVLESRGINSVREAAALTPGLNINSDGTGRAFVAIRGVGVTLVQTVQPGVGLFIDGIYQPNTSYLNNPLLDVARIEVLRGPQGTLYGKNTLGGAINVITRAPSNQLEVRALASYARPDDQLLLSGSVSGPIIEDHLQVRIAASHREQDGFLRNIVVGGNANPLNTDSINGTIRLAADGGAEFTIKGYYDWVDGVNTPYARVTGPTDYSRNIQFNTINRVSYRYRGLSGRLELPVDALHGKLSAIASLDKRDGRVRDGEGDFGPLNIVRTRNTDVLTTKTGELRLDSEWTSQFSSLFGLFYSRESTGASGITSIIPLARNVAQTNATRADTYAAFGTVFWKPSTDWEIAVGLRYDHENRRARGTVGGAAIPDAQIKSNQVQPKLTLTRHWSPELMSYASVARGYRGGGFNAPNAPFRTYKGDSAWTYELGTKIASADRRFSLSGDVFYNDYKNYIGLNSIAPAVPAGLVTVDLNTGDVESYGAELEGFVKPVPAWTISGGLTLMHARITDATPYTRTTGRTLSSDRLTFQPDVTANLYSDYRIDLGGDKALTLTGGMTYKGKRLTATLNQTTPTYLKGYALFNAGANFDVGPIEIGLFANNIFNKKYFESYIEKTTLALAGLPASDLGIIGDLRRYGVRASLKF